jgi:GntR family transcriptional regulator
VITLERARLSEGQTVIYSLDNFPAHLLPALPDSTTLTGSLLELLEAHGTRLETSKTTIRAVLLDPKLAARLEVNPTAPWILLEQINYDRRDQPVLYSRDYHNAEKFQFRVVRRRR